MNTMEEIALGMKALSRKGIEAFSAGDHARALNIFEQAAVLEQKANLPVLAAESWFNCANVLFVMGERATAREKLAAALTVFRKYRRALGQFGVLQLQGQLELDEGDLAAAARCFEACLNLRCGRRENGIAQFQLAVLSIRRGDRGRAMLLLNRAIDDLTAAGDSCRLVEALRQRAALYPRSGSESYVLGQQEGDFR